MAVVAENVACLSGCELDVFGAHAGEDEVHAPLLNIKHLVGGHALRRGGEGFKLGRKEGGPILNETDVVGGHALRGSGRSE
jgi:hypothetical protein